MTAAKETVDLAAVLLELDRISLWEKNRSALKADLREKTCFYSNQDKFWQDFI